MIENHKFRHLCKIILTLSYGFNDFKEKLHEDKMIEILNFVGMIDSTKEYRSLKQDLLDKLRSDMSPGDDISYMEFDNDTFVYQPYGSHNAPDFLLFVNNTYLMIELKSSKSDGITWNTHLPRKNWIYIFSVSGKKINKTTYFLGQELISDIFRKEIEEKYEICYKRIKKELNDEVFGSPNNIFGFSDYLRPMFQCDEKFFNNESKQKNREKNVSTFVKNIFREKKK